MKKILSPLLPIALCAFGYLNATARPILAQVTPDTSSINSQVNQNGNVAEITGGQTRGGNLFHSFQDFSVTTGNEAFFNNADSIANILGRVTGGNVSNIDGLIRANGSANLFLINPAGIIFGQNARLDIGGSFLGSSASSILFENGEFSATDLENAPLLTINAPIGLGFRDNPGDIVNRSIFDGVGLSVNGGESISLIGGNVNIEDGGIVFAPGGRVELGGLIETGTINITEDNSLTFPDDLARGDVSITDSALVSVFVGASNSSEEAGNIDITSSSLNIDNGSRLVATNSAVGDGGDVAIDATDKVSIANASAINVVASGGGSVTIDAKNLELTAGSNILAGISSDAGTEDAQAGDITINTSEDVLIDAAGEELTQITNTNFGGTGNAGNVVINSRNVSLIGGGVSSFNNGRGSGGDISINATGDISFDAIAGSQRGGIANFSSNNAGVGTVGDIELQAQNLSITNGGAIFSLVLEEITNSGDINIDIADTIRIDGSQEVILSDGTPSRLASSITSGVSNPSTSGNSGDININTQNLFLSRNGHIDGSIVGRGSAGDININADLITIGEPGNTSLVPSSIISVVGGGSEAAVEEVNGGNITIDTGSLFVSDGGSIDVGIRNDVTGTGGNITINATDTVSVDGTGFFNDTEVRSDISADIGQNSTGNAGNIAIDTAQLLVTNGAFISADISQEANGNGGSIEVDAEQISLSNSSISAEISQEASGNGGNIEIFATDSIELSDSVISANILENATGDGGNLNIETGSLVLTDASQIAVSTLGNGNGGNISIIATESIDLSGVDEVNQFRTGLLAVAFVGDGNGGNLKVVTNELNITDGATIQAGNFPSFETSDTQPGTGEPGNINIEANSINLSEGGRIDAATQSAAGEGANIDLRVAEDITLRDDSFISARAFKAGNGGNLSIDTRFIVAFPDGNNDIIASASQGNGGNIRINAESLLGIAERPLNNSTNDINASSEFSLDGSITINTPYLDPSQGTTELSQNVVQPEQTTAQVCAANREAVASSGFTITGKGGIPPAPGLPLDSLNVIINGETNPTSTIPEPIETSQGKIQPARGVRVTESGDIILTAYRTNNAGDRIPNGKLNCP